MKNCSADVAACRNRPEWAGLACQTGPAAQPTTGPKLAVMTVTYTRDQQIASSVETYGTGVSRTKTISYDAAGRPTQQTVSSSGESPVSTTVAPITTTYNIDNGMAAQTTLGTGSTATTITRGYDTMGRLASYTDTLDVQSTRTYDLVGRLASLNDTKGTTSFSYGPDGLLSVISDSRSGTQQATRDVDGQVTLVTLPGAIRRVDRFDATGARVARCYATGPAGCEDPLLELEAERGARGEIVAAHRAGFSDTRYAYDPAGRLTDATDDRDADGCTARAYTYDPDSNRLSRSWRHAPQGDACTVTGGQSESLSYDDGDRLHAPGLIYDQLGRTSQLPAIAGGAPLQASYFADDQARSVTQDGLTKTLTLDALRRTTTTLSSSGTSTSDHYTDDTDTPAWSTTDTTLERHVTGFDGTWALAEHDTTHSVLLADLRGDILATADPATHAITPTADLDEFGTPQTPTGRYGFLGTHARTSTLPSGLITMGARLYTPQLGRFLQVDPVISGSANAYDYCNAEPINCTDLRGTRPDGPSYYGELDSCVWGEGCDTSSELGAVLLTALAFAPVPGLQQYAAARVAITAARKYKSGGRLLGEIRWGAKGKNGRGSQYIRFDAGGRHGVHLDVRVGKFRKRHWKPWER